MTLPREDIHGRFARNLDFLAEYIFVVRNRKSSLVDAENILSKIILTDNGIYEYAERFLVKLIVEE